MPCMIRAWAQVSEVASKARETTAEAYHAAVESAEAAVRAAREKVGHGTALEMTSRSIFQY